MAEHKHTTKERKEIKKRSSHESEHARDRLRGLRFLKRTGNNIPLKRAIPSSDGVTLEFKRKRTRPERFLRARKFERETQELRRKAKKAGSFRAIAKETVRGLPRAAKKVGRRILSGGLRRRKK